MQEVITKQMISNMCLICTILLILITTTMWAAPSRCGQVEAFVSISGLCGEFLAFVATVEIFCSILRFKDSKA